MNEDNLSDSEIQKLRADLAEASHRVWLWRMIRTGIAWIGGVGVAAVSLANGVRELVEWATRK